jgi:hypothetical protein
MPSFPTNWATGLLRGFLRATNPTSNIAIAQLSFASGLRYRNVTGTDFGAASSGVCSLVGTPLAMTHANTGTMTTGSANGPGGGDVSGLTLGTSAPCELESNTAVGVISSSSSPPASSITRFSVGFPSNRSTVLINTALRNKMAETMAGKNTAHWAANGTIKVYSGAAPSSADDAATGTELWSVATDQTSSFSWNDVASNACALAANLTATSNAFGANQVAGYARLAWTHGGTDYVIQGSVGEGTGDFQFVNLDGGSNNEMAQSTSYSINNATIGF